MDWQTWPSTAWAAVHIIARPTPLRRLPRKHTERPSGAWSVRPLSARFVVVLLTLYFPCLILWTFAEPILRSLHQPESVVTLAASYGRLRTRLLVFALANSVLLKTLNAVGRPAPAVVASIVSAALAVPLGWLLIVHYDLGVVGAAYHATALEAVSCAIYVIGALASPAVRRCALFKPSVRAFRGWRAYLRVALPAFATLMVEMVAWELLEFPAGLCRPTPEAALGAYAILYNIVYLAEAPAFGLGGGAASVVGNAAGRGRRTARVPSGAAYAHHRACDCHSRHTPPPCVGFIRRRSVVVSGR